MIYIDTLLKMMLKVLKCDIIKGNESDVKNIDFESQPEIGDKFLWYTLFWI